MEIILCILLASGAGFSADGLPVQASSDPSELKQQAEEQRFQALKRKIELDPCFGMPLPGGTPCNFPSPLTFAEIQKLQDRDLPIKDPILYRKMTRRIETPLIRNLNPAAVRDGKVKNGMLTVVEMNVDEFKEFHGIKALLNDCDDLQRRFLPQGTVIEGPVREKLCRASQADFYFLNEADAGVCRSGYHSAEELAMRMDLNLAQAMEWFEVRPDLVGQRDGGPGCNTSEMKPELLRNEQYNVLLSRFPLRSARRLALKNCHDWYEQEQHDEMRRGSRNALIVEVEIPGEEIGSIALVVTHLENKTTAECRDEQLAQIDQALTEMEQAQGRKIPVVLGGDMNSSLGSESLLKDFMKNRKFETDDRFRGSFLFNQNLDFIFTRRTENFQCLRLVEADVIREAGPPEFNPVTLPLSDHAATIADFPIRCAHK